MDEVDVSIVVWAGPAATGVDVADGSCGLGEWGDFGDDEGE